MYLIDSFTTLYYAFLTMNKIKLIALDIDGTICNSHRGYTVSPAVVQAIAQAKQQGVYVSLCTGRWHDIMTDFYPAVATDDDTMHVSCNGSVVLNHQGSILHKQGLTMTEVADFLHEIEQAGIGYGACDARSFYANPIAYTQEDVAKHCHLYESKDQFLAMPYLSKLYVDGRKHKQHVQDILRNYSFAYAVDFTGFFDIWPSHVHKGTGIDWIAKQLNLQLDEVMFVGDGSNDLDALRVAGLGIAMGQADDDVKAVANVVAPSVDDDGVAWAIRQYVLTH
jgi:Cof subfamily protein (haloacid dehalogenase superfamily)